MKITNNHSETVSIKTLHAGDVFLAWGAPFMLLDFQLLAINDLPYQLIPAVNLSTGKVHQVDNSFQVIKVEPELIIK